MKRKTVHRRGEQNSVFHQPSSSSARSALKTVASTAKLAVIASVAALAPTGSDDCGHRHYNDESILTLSTLPSAFGVPSAPPPSFFFFTHAPPSFLRLATPAAASAALSMPFRLFTFADAANTRAKSTNLNQNNHDENNDDYNYNIHDNDHTQKQQTQIRRRRRSTVGNAPSSSSPRPQPFTPAVVLGSGGLPMPGGNAMMPPPSAFANRPPPPHGGGGMGGEDIDIDAIEQRILAQSASGENFLDKAKLNRYSRHVFLGRITAVEEREHAAEHLSQHRRMREKKQQQEQKEAAQQQQGGGGGEEEKDRFSSSASASRSLSPRMSASLSPSPPLVEVHYRLTVLVLDTLKTTQCTFPAVPIVVKRGEEGGDAVADDRDAAAVKASSASSSSSSSSAMTMCKPFLKSEKPHREETVGAHKEVHVLYSLTARSRKGRRGNEGRAARAGDKDDDATADDADDDDLAFHPLRPKVNDTSIFFTIFTSKHAHRGQFEETFPAAGEETSPTTNNKGGRRSRNVLEAALGDAEQRRAMRSLSLSASIPSHRKFSANAANFPLDELRVEEKKMSKGDTENNVRKDAADPIVKTSRLPSKQKGKEEEEIVHRGKIKRKGKKNAKTRGSEEDEDFDPAPFVSDDDEDDTEDDNVVKQRPAAAETSSSASAFHHPSQPLSINTSSSSYGRLQEEKEEEEGTTSTNPSSHSTVSINTYIALMPNGIECLSCRNPATKNHNKKEGNAFAAAEDNSDHFESAVLRSDYLMSEEELSRHERETAHPNSHHFSSHSSHRGSFRGHFDDADDFVLHPNAAQQQARSEKDAIASHNFKVFESAFLSARHSGDLKTGRNKKKKLFMQGAAKDKTEDLEEGRGVVDGDGRGECRNNNNNNNKGEVREGGDSGSRRSVDDRGEEEDLRGEL